MIWVATHLKLIGTDTWLTRREQRIKELQNISIEVVHERDHLLSERDSLYNEKEGLRTELDELTRKLADAEVSKDAALRGKVDAEAVTEAFKKFFDTNKKTLKAAKDKAKKVPGDFSYSVE